MDWNAAKYPLFFSLAFFSVATLYLFRRKKPYNTLLKDKVYSANPPTICRIATRQEVLTDNQVLFLVSVKSKDFTKPPRDPLRKTNPFLYPFEPGLLIHNFDRNYRLLFNKYPVFDKHLLIVTYQFQSQSDPLTLEDFEVISLVCGELNAFAFYNSGPASGHSQEHKHIQIVPYKSSKGVPIDALVAPLLQDAPFALPSYPFKHLFHGIPPGSSAEEIFSIYSRLKALTSAKESHNLVITKTYMLLVPREKERAFNRFDVNALGYVGFLLVRDEEEFENLRKVGPLGVIRDTAIKL